MKSFKQFLNERASVSKKTDYNNDPSLIDETETCIYRDDYKCVEECFEKGLDPNAEDTTDKCPLCIVAIQRGQYKIVQLFVNNGFNVNSQFQKESALENAISMYNLYKSEDYVKIIDLLLSEGADVNYFSSRQSLLYRAVYEEHFDLATKLIQHNADVNWVMPVTTNPIIMSAVYDDKVNFVELLLKNGADPKIKNKWDESPFGYMTDPTTKHHKEYMKILKETNHL